MSLLNVISVPTTNGIKTIEIHNCDITKLDWEVDILLVSAFQNKYKPRPNTVIQSLEDNSGLRLEELSLNPLLDLRSSLECWISNEVQNQNFKHILCVEGIKSNINLTGSSVDAFSSLFATLSILQYKKIRASSVALPILGTGFQGNPVDLVLPFLVDNTINCLKTNSELKTVYFVEIDKGKAQLIDDTINRYLKRGRDKLEMIFEDPAVISQFEQILGKLLRVQKGNRKFSNTTTINNLIDKIHNQDLRFFELGILCRKLVELLIADISTLKSDKYISLFEYISDLKSRNVAEWMITYIHTLRVFGNFVAHADQSNEIPSHMERTDILVFSYALNRFLDFYLSFKSNQK
jgi:hypothetical protein